ncbi:MAG TPA: PQQ-dependent sugar dehydrogenase [Puia sp.]|nr:PQQ-dependent sugar dehydrogenase [Puia sp.]
MKSFWTRIDCLLLTLLTSFQIVQSQTITYNNQVFKLDTLYPSSGNNGLSFPWEITYGPDDSLWVTEAHGYRIWKIHPQNKGSRLVLDLNDLKNFNYYKPKVGSTNVIAPQGGLEGLAIHPLFNNGKPYVYVVIVYYLNAVSGEPDIVSDSGTMSTNNDLCNGTSSNGHPCFYKSKVLRYTYDFATGTLGSMQVMLDGLDGSNDHNSGRLKISPAGAESDGNYYLYYTIGDMGAGQFNNASRINNAQDKDIYEGKVLRLNTEPDGDAANVLDPYNQWIPNSNPFTNSSTGYATAVYSYGHRNSQGLVWANISGTWILYNSEHGDKSDDEINIIEKGKNYGWPKVAGMCDDNYNDTDANANNDYLANKLVHNEHEFCTLYNVKEPLFSFFNVNGTDVPSSGASNFTWPTIAPSSIDYYDKNSIPGWNNSLLVTSLKLGMYRLKLKPDGSAVDSASTPQIIDTIPYLHGYRIRDVAIAPTGDTLFLAIDSSGSTSGPTGGFGGSSTNVTNAGFILRMVYIQTLPLDDSPAQTAYRQNKPGHVLIYPNPASGFLHVLCMQGMHKPFLAKLYDMSGNLVLQKNSSNESFIIEVNKLPPGVYAFKLYNGYGSAISIEKIIIR